MSLGRNGEGAHHASGDDQSPRKYFGALAVVEVVAHAWADPVFGLTKLIQRLYRPERGGKYLSRR